MAHFYRVSETRSLAKARVSGQAGQVLPLDFSFLEEDGRLLLKVASASGVTDEEIFGQVQRECDRIAFLTGEDPDPRLTRKDNPDGSTTAIDSRGGRTAGYVSIPADIARQQWDTPPLPAQLRLWQLASLPRLPVAVRIVLLFQIIEMDPSSVYPQYVDSSKEPDRRTETKLLRDLASHGRKVMVSSQVRAYCAHHNVPAVSHDPRDASLIQLFNERLFVVEQEARKSIEQAITRTQQASK